MQQINMSVEIQNIAVDSLESNSLDINHANQKSLISIFLPALAGGGAERAMLHLAQGLAERGYRIDLVLAKAEGDYLASVPPAIRIVDLQAGFPVLVSKTLALRRYLQQERPAVLFSALDILSSATWAQRLARGSTQIIMCVQTHLSHQFQNHQPYTIGRLRPHLVRWLYPWSDAIVAASHGVAADLSRLARIPIEQIQVIHNPVVTPEVVQKMQVNVEHPWFNDSIPVVLGVGRLVSQKDFPTLIQAFAQVRQHLPARLMILGEGEDRPQLEAQIRQLQLEQDVALPGFVENPYAYMAKADVFALSSIFEGFGNVVAEAMAAGTPIVSTDCDSGPAEILVNGQFGKLVPVGDSEALAAAIIETLQNPPDSERLRQRAQAFSLEQVTEQYINVLENAIQQSRLQAS